MTTNIEQMNANIARFREDIRMDRRKVVLQTVATVVAAFAAGVGALALYLQLRH